MNLKRVLMELGNALVAEHHFDPACPTYNPNNTLAITDFTNWLNGCKEAQHVLYDLGYEWPASEEAKPSLRQEIAALAQRYNEAGSQCEKHGNTVGTVHMRSIGNLLYAIAQGHDLPKIVPMSTPPLPEHFEVFKLTANVHKSVISTLISETLERIVLNNAEDTDDNQCLYDCMPDVENTMEITVNCKLHGKENCDKFKELWNELKQFSV